MNTPYRKPFSSNLYSRFDHRAKNTLIKHLTSHQHRILKTSESYDADVVSESLGIRYFNEAEIKTAWTGDWPKSWKEIRVPERKKRLLEKHIDPQTRLQFYIFRYDCQQAWLIDSSLLTDRVLREAYGRNIHEGEQFYHVPYYQAELINILS